MKLESVFVELTKSTKRINSATRKRAEFPDGFETEPHDIRKQILRAENEVKNIESSIDSFEYQIQSLQEEEKILSIEAAKYPDEEVIICFNLQDYNHSYNRLEFRNRLD